MRGTIKAKKIKESGGGGGGMARGTIKAKKRKWADGKSEEEVSPAYACMHMREREGESKKRKDI